MADLILNAPLQYEPLKVNRWSIIFHDDVGVQPFMLKEMQSPKANNNAVKMAFINTETYVKGKTTWAPMSGKIRDFIAPSSRQALMEWQRLHHEAVTGRDGYAVGYKKNIYLNMLDPTGVTVSRWRLEGCMLSGDIDFGALTYDSDEVVEISFTIQPDRCILEF